MQAGKGTLDRNVSFRATERMVADIAAHQRGRQLRDFSDAAREVMQDGLDRAQPSVINTLATEYRRLGGDPEAALKTAIASLEREDCQLAAAQARETTPADLQSP